MEAGNLLLYLWSMQNNYPTWGSMIINRTNVANKYYYTRDVRPDHEERYSTINQAAPNPTNKPKFKLTTISTWFLCPVGRPLSTNTVYFATERKIFNGRHYPNVCYKIGGTWYREDLFKSIKEL